MAVKLVRDKDNVPIQIPVLDTLRAENKTAGENSSVFGDNTQNNGQLGVSVVRIEALSDSYIGWGPSTSIDDTYCNTFMTAGTSDYFVLKANYVVRVKSGTTGSINITPSEK